MAVLKFLCPTSGNEVDTGLDLDARTFAGLLRDHTKLSCPHCPIHTCLPLFKLG
jgi:hypothetical protein